jgi:hypothetical protein
LAGDLVLERSNGQNDDWDIISFALDFALQGSLWRLLAEMNEEKTPGGE